MKKTHFFILFILLTAGIHAQNLSTYSISSDASSGEKQLPQVKSSSLLSKSTDEFTELRSESLADKYTATCQNAYSTVMIPKESKFHLRAEAGYSFGLPHYNIDYLLFNGIYGYQVYPCLSLGIGTGLRYALGVNDALIPFFVAIRANTNSKHFPFYFDLNTGYSLDITSDFKTEGFYFLFNPTIGLLIKSSGKVLINAGIGYQFQDYKISTAKYTHIAAGSTIHTKGICVITGITF